MSNNNSNNTNNARKEKEFSDYVVSVKRVTKVTKGGKRFQFSAYVVSGNMQGMIGVGKGKGKDVTLAVAKATARARKHMFSVDLKDKTIPYSVLGKHGASSVLLQPAYTGTGMIAGGTVRFVLKSAGIENILAKSIGTSRSGINVVKATLNALSKCRSLQHISKLRGLTKKQIIKGAHDVE